MGDERGDLPTINREDEVPEFTSVEDEATFWATHQPGADLLRALERRSLVELLELRATADRPAAPSRRWIRRKRRIRKVAKESPPVHPAGDGKGKNEAKGAP